MKITKVKWNNHPVLGNLALDFLNPTTNEPFDTIIFAGENGTGKTTILEAISTFLNVGSFEHFDYIEYIVDGEIYKAVQDIPPNEISKDFFDVVDKQGDKFLLIRSNKSNSPNQIELNKKDPRHYGCIFSKARADYKTQLITSTTTKQLDDNKYDSDNEDDFTALKQLIVDVENQDNSDYKEINKAKGHSPMMWDEFYQTSKIYRFKNAFDSFFEKLKYEKVSDLGSEKSILFTKNGKSISIDKLSTGEKQIVFRGIYLLKNIKKLNGASIMIDEPELSMHPKWQKNILKYYKDLFTEKGKQTVQLFFASHSEHVLKEALKNKSDNLVIVLSDNNGTIESKRIDSPVGVLPSITAAETSYLVFDIASNDYHIELYGWLQEKEKLVTVKPCDKFIKVQTPYQSNIHSRSSNFESTIYETLSTFVRNAIHHPKQTETYTEDELRTSIKLLIELCK